MSTLHTVNKALSRSPVLESCLRLLQAGDALLLLEDGVYAARQNAVERSLWHDIPQDVRLYVLGPDLVARGISGLQAGFTVVDDAGFVQLCCDCDKTVSWF